MQQNPSSSPIPTPSYLPKIPELPSTGLQVPIDDPTSSALFEWSDFLDFNLDETLSISFPQPEPDNQPSVSADPESQSSADNSDRVRKRDPRLVCSNFLAGRVPCACPELDKLLEEEEESAGLPGKKRARTGRGSGGGGGPVRCQVPGCEADISELKGYHKRHRVCLMCANAGEVVLDGESKRYCQQCGKFHILSDFDEGKRSCRRKLERHNNRRRRKPNERKEGPEKEAQPIVLADDVSGDDSAGKEGICANSQSEEKERFLEPDGHMSTLCSGPGSQKSDSVVSFAASDEAHTDRENQNPKYKRSPSYCENKSAFPSVCPAGRISFKLYDWNPAEFPRRLRHQIFQWLSSMPVELEGYIRPGCTILTAFIAMPRPLWLRLMEEPARHIKDLVASPGSMLSGRGTMLVYLNDMMFQVTKDATSIVSVKVKDRVPKLHYVYPTCFEAGRPMEFVACGTDLLQSNFRFLVSFAGRYLAYNISVSLDSCEKGDAKSIDHQLLKIHVPQTDIDLLGPGFIEVENQSGLSNFIPILVGDKETCAEMEILQQKFDIPLSSQEQKPPPQRFSCEVLALRQAQFSDFLLDVACLLKNPVSGQQLTSSHIQRFNCLLNCLIEKESSVILGRVFCSLQSLMADNLVAGVSDIDMRLLRKIMGIAQSKLAQMSLEKAFSVVPDGNFYSHNSGNDDQSVGPAPNQGCPRILKSMLGVNGYSQSIDESATVPLLKGEVIMNVNLQEQPEKYARRLLTGKLSTSRTLIIAISAIGVCFGLCAVVLHPRGVGQIATTIRRCLFVD